MTALIIILGLLVITAIGFAFFFMYKYADIKYHFNLLGIGFLSIIPPALASIGFFIVGGDNYFKALQQGNLDVLVSLGVAAIAFMGIFIFFYRKTNLWIALFTMSVVSLCLFIFVFLSSAGIIGTLLHFMVVGRVKFSPVTHRIYPVL